MNWEAIGAVGEIIGAIAVIVTLLYLAMQLRQYSTGMSTATFHSSMQGFNTINAMLVQNPALAEIYSRGMSHPDSLTLEEQTQVVWLMRCYVNIFENLYHQFRKGACPESYWVRYARELKQTIDSPGGRLFRKTNTTYVELYDYVDSMPQSDLQAYDFKLSNADSEDDNT